MPIQTIKAWLRRRRLEQAGIRVAEAAPMHRAGDRSGVWAVRPDLLPPRPLVYSFGVGNNISWDLAMIRDFAAQVYAFDPTPTCAAWLKTQTLPPSFHFEPIGLAGHDGTLTLHAPRKAGRFNFSAFAARDCGQETVAVPVTRLQTLADRLQHEHLDVLKMDIEGAEMAALPDLLASSVGVSQLLVEFHYNFAAIGLPAVAALVRQIEQQGFRLAHLSPRGYEFSFCNPARAAARLRHAA